MRVSWKQKAEAAIEAGYEIEAKFKNLQDQYDALETKLNAFREANQRLHSRNADYLEIIKNLSERKS